MLFKVNVIVFPAAAIVISSPIKVTSVDPGTKLIVFELESEISIVCAAISVNFAILTPPATAPSCTRKVSKSVSTVTSPTAPVNEPCMLMLWFLF